MTYPSLAPSWRFSATLFTLGYPFISMVATILSSPQSADSPLAMLPILAAFLIFAAFIFQGFVVAFVPFIVGLLIGTLYFMVFAVIEGARPQFSASKIHASILGATLGAAGTCSAWALQNIFQSAPVTIGISLFSLLVVLGAALGAVGPALIAFDGPETTQ